MAKHIDTKTVKFVEYNNLEGTTISDHDKRFLNCEGLLIIMKTDRRCRKHRGQYYLDFYPNEQGETEQRHFDTPVGDIIYEDDRIIFNCGNKYVFQTGDFLADEEREQISSNLFFGIKSMVY